MQNTPVFTPLSIGSFTLKNRIFMAPLTRLRNTEPDGVPTPLAQTYYGQRASAGLVISEGAHISPKAKGYAHAPGIYSQEQVKAWKAVTDTVHQAQGKIAVQLWHTGRISHRSLLPNHMAPVAPSAIQAKSNTNILDEHHHLVRAPCDLPRALTLAELPGILQDFHHATLCAQQAGFDLVEIHSAHGYLLDQFLCAESNQRTDQYGGSVENRARFVLEVVDTVIDAWDAQHVSIRLSPLGSFNGLSLANDPEISLYVIEQLAKRALAYLHISEPDWQTGSALSDDFRQTIRQRFPGVIVGAGKYTLEKANTLIEKGYIDAAAFGRQYIANPDLVERLRTQAPLNTPDATTFYGGGEHGYTDYSFLNDSASS